MRKEMTELRAADRKSADELSTARLENADLRRQLDAVKAEAMANRGNDERDRIEVDAMREDLRVFSRSFSDFLGHYDSVAREVRSNHSTLLKEIAWAKKSVRDLSSSLGQADHDVGSVRTAVSELKDSVATLTQRDFILEKRLEASENLTETVATAINSEVTKIRESVVPAKTFAEAVAGLTKEIDLVARHMSKNISTTAQTLMKRVDASNRQASLALTDLRATTDTLETDLKRQGQAFSQDFDSFQKSVDLAKQKYDELTITLDKRLEQHAEMRGNLTAAMLRAMNELSDRVDENDAKLLTLKPDFEALDESHRQLVNQVGAEVVQLRVADANASKRLLKMETIGNTTDLRLGKIEKMIDVLDVAGESLRTEVTKNQSKVSNQFGRMEAHFVDLRRSLFERSQELTTLDERLDEVEEDARRSSSEAETMLAQITRVYVEQGKLIAGLDNRTLSLRADLRTNISRVLVFAAENKATLLELRVAEQRLEDEINGVRDAQQRQGAAMASTNAAAAANATRLAAATAAMQSDADGMTERLQNLEESLSRHVQSTGELEIQMGRVRVGHKDAVSSLRRNLGELESTIGELTTNLTAVTVNVGQTQDRVGRLGDRVIATESQLEQHALNFSKEFSNTDERFQMLQVNSSTLKANIVGLGNYINNINGDVGKLASTFEKYIGDITRGMVGVAENVTAMEKALEKQRSGIQSMKIEQEEIRSQSKSLDAQVQSLSSIRDSHSKDISGLKNEVSTLRTGMSGITTSLFGLKSQAVASADVSGRVSQLSDDLTATKREMGRLERSVSTVLPEMESLATDMDTVRRSVTSIAAEVSAGPPRFSCAVTSDEVTYNRRGDTPL